MRNKLLLIFLSLGLLVSCGDSKFGAGNNPSNPNTVSDPIDTFDGSDKPVKEIVKYHCDSVSRNQYSSLSRANYFVGSGTVGGGGSSYRKLLAIQGVCLESGWSEYSSGNYYSGQYAYYGGTSSCSYWDQNYELTIGFENGNSKMAGIQIKTTGDGFPAGWNGQGFPTENMRFDGYIDCTEEDLTINALAWNQNSNRWGYLTVVVPNEYGHKNHYSLRATLYFRPQGEGAQKIGTSRLIIQ